MKTIGKASNQAQNGLVQIVDGTPKVSHISIAENTSNKVGTVKRLIDNYKQEVEEFGMLGFKIHTSKNCIGATHQSKEYFLTEDQAIFLMTLLRNNEVVVNFKKNLVKAFIKLKVENNPPRQQIDLNDPKACLGEAISLAIKAGIRYNEKESAFKTFAHKTMDQIGEYKEEIEKLKSKNDQYKALHTGVARLGTKELNISMGEMAQQLGMSRPALFKELRYRGVLTMKNIPTKRFLVDNLLVVAKMSYQRGERMVNNYKQTLITPEGVKYLRSMFA